jgi:hypothetical protein
MINIIKITHDSISMNIIVYQCPMHIYHSDSCPAGLGGYNNSSFAWQYYLKPEHQFQATNNLLEHIAAIITPWVDIIWARLLLGGCALSMTNSTTSEGWLHKTNFSKLKEDPIQATVRLEVARCMPCTTSPTASENTASGFWVKPTLLPTLSLVTTIGQTAN